MGSIIFAVAAVTMIGAVCSVMLVAAAKVMAIKTDEREEAVRALLPVVNCGVCGYPGCDGYAAALIGGAGTNLCLPGGASVSKQISDTLGVGFEDFATRIAVVRCRGECTVRQDKMEYAGIRSCAAAKQLFGGRSACVYGCIGYGDCVNACPGGAIRIVNGIAKTDASACTGCGLCIKTCPNRVITTHIDTIRIVVRCSSKDRGANVRRACTHGCTACGICERECPLGAVVVTDNLAHIDYNLCDGCGRCSEACPAGCIQPLQESGDTMHQDAADAGCE